jgi:hypothetical protein
MKAIRNVSQQRIKLSQVQAGEHASLVARAPEPPAAPPPARAPGASRKLSGGRLLSGDADASRDPRFRSRHPVAEGDVELKLGLLARVPSIFQGAEPEQMREMAAGAEWVVAVSGEALVTQGENGDSMFIVESGSLDAVVKHVGTVKSYGAAEYFGEQALAGADAGVRQATVVVTSGMAKCLKLTRETAAPVLIPIRFAAEAQAVKYNKVWDPLLGRKRKLLLYAVFLCLFTAVSVGARGSVLHHQNALVTSLFKLRLAEQNSAQHTVHSWADFDTYLATYLLPALHNPILFPGGEYPLQLVSGYEIKQWRVAAGAAPDCEARGLADRGVKGVFGPLGHLLTSLYGVP